MEQVLNIILKLEAENAFVELCDGIAEIKNVSDWARESEISVSELRKTIESYYGVSTEELLKQVRYQKILEVIKKKPLATCRYVAICCGLSSVNELKEFLRTNYQTTFNELLKEVVRGNIQPLEDKELS